MQESFAQWAPFSMPTAEDKDTFIAIRLAMVDGGLPATWEEADRKMLYWHRYLPRARAIRLAEATA
jgi:hypothetical protein